jgi:hypothetical protein
MNRDEKIAHVLRCMAGDKGIPLPLADLKRVVENAAAAVDEKWPDLKPTTPPGAE